MNHRERLRALLVERSLKTGDFTLASGARSSYYIDARRTTMSAEGQFLTGKVCWEALGDTVRSVTHVGGPTLGADPVAYAIAHHSWSEEHRLDGFTIRKEPKGHGTRQQVEGGVPPGAPCLVVEDSMTTGSSTLVACRALEEHGGVVVAVLTLIDREEGAAERIAEAGYPFLSVYSGRELVEAASTTSDRGARG